MFSLRDCQDLSPHYEIKIHDLNMEGASSFDGEMSYLISHTQTSPRTSQPVLGSNKHRDNYSQVKKKKLSAYIALVAGSEQKPLVFERHVIKSLTCFWGCKTAKATASAFYPNS